MKTDLYLSSQKVCFDVIPHRSTYDAQRMAQVLHLPGREVAKTVLLRADSGYTYIVAVLPVTMNIDLAKISQALGGSKIELASEQELAAYCTDCEMGVLPPFGSQYGMTTLVEKCLTQDEEIVFEGNRHGEAIRMAFDDYRRVEEPLIVSFACDCDKPKMKCR